MHYDKAYLLLSILKDALIRTPEIKIIKAEDFDKTFWINIELNGKTLQAEQISDATLPRMISFLYGKYNEKNDINSTIDDLIRDYEYVNSKVNWGASTLDGTAITAMNSFVKRLDLIRNMNPINLTSELTRIHDKLYSMYEDQIQNHDLTKEQFLEREHVLQNMKDLIP